MVWLAATAGGVNAYSHDLLTRKHLGGQRPRTTTGWRTCTTRLRALGERGSGALVLQVPGRAEEVYPELEFHIRLSPSGNYVLAVEGTEEASWRR